VYGYVEVTAVLAPQRRIALALAVVGAATLFAACDDGHASPRATPTTLAPASTTADVNAATRATFSGDLTLDGAPFDATFLGAVVRRDSLITPCQYNLPSVTAGRYEITVLADAESAGCGAPGAEILLWTFVDDQFLFAQAWTPWPADGATATIDASFATATPAGARPPVTEFSGEIYTRDGDHLPAGARVEAYIGDTLCGVASARGFGSFEGYVMDVVGPESRPGCNQGATITLLVNGTPAAETTTNTLQPVDHGGSFDLTLP
jgi:hypothetical protein